MESPKSASRTGAPKATFPGMESPKSVSAAESPKATFPGMESPKSASRRVSTAKPEDEQSSNHAKEAFQPPPRKPEAVAAKPGAVSSQKSTGAKKTADGSQLPGFFK